jgi:hypothetical protein
MRTAFKVATVFTGAAACAAAFTPAATAATVTTLKTNEVHPDTVKRDCAIGPTTTSMVFWWEPLSAHGPVCVGSADNPAKNVNLGGQYFSYICTGNNYGWLSDGNGSHVKFRQSDYPAPWGLPVYTVHISGHGGSYRCST